MARIEGEIVIGRPVDVVFDYVADQGNEPQYNPRMVRAEKITAGPVGKGTQFRSAVASMGRTAEMLIECTGYDRPTLFASTTMMQPQATGMSTTTRRTPHCPSREIVETYVAAPFKAPWHIDLLNINLNNEDLAEARQRTGQYMDAFGRDGTCITPNLDFEVARSAAV